ncbi:MAG: S8 family serine peptidase [Paraprevotella sp.]|nr:S8 family serine peptidase [Paraprevotella sp.]
MKRLNSLLVIMCACVFCTHAQTPLDWHLRSLGPDSIWGAGIEKAYQLLDGKKAKKKVRVAVISRGFDIEHEDLVDVLWTNKKEKPGNDADDDKNGYADDVHGWNFLGTKDGRDVIYTSEAASRKFDGIRARFEELNDKGRSRTQEETAEYMRYLNLVRDSKVESAYMSSVFSRNIAKGMEEIDQKLRETFPNDSDFTYEQFMKIIPAPEKQDSLNDMAYNVNMLIWGFSPQQMWSDRYKIRDKSAISYEEQYQALKARQKDERGIIGDNMGDIDDDKYGNANLLTGNPSVGTGLAGVIAAKRGNDIGIDGIADNAELMLIRAVPEGDGYDKDMAVAIRYAIKNGADIILLAMHKKVAEDEEIVRQALDEAEQKNILIVHAAGESPRNIDDSPTYPSGLKADGSYYANFINVAASDVDGLPLHLSNYGKKNVDLFAPGVDVYSCDAGDNYFKLTGTNASAAVVAGVAALIKSRFPKLTAAQIKESIVTTATNAPTEGVFYPFMSEASNVSPTPARYSELCKSGGIVDAAAAVQKAMNIK